MLTCVMFNISLRVKAYLDSPIRVNIDVKQHTELKFPAVTICNKNFARYVPFTEGFVKFCRFSSFVPSKLQEGNVFSRLCLAVSIYVHMGVSSFFSKVICRIRPIGLNSIIDR